MLNKILSATSLILFALIIAGITDTAFAQHSGSHNQMAPLAEPGNTIFGTIQEVVKKLEADPNTDWEEVDLEALRQHLLDMKAFTEDVTIISQEPITNGNEIRISPDTDRAFEALKRLFNMHPAMLKKETGWNMEVKQVKSEWVITCTTDLESDIPKVRALGYIGLLAKGAHHQHHHWMIATGKMGSK